MVVIEEDGVRVEAETMRKARAALRKAKAAAEAEARSSQERHTRASLEAEAHIGHIARFCADDPNASQVEHFGADALHYYVKPADVGHSQCAFRILGNGGSAVVAFYSKVSFEEGFADNAGHLLALRARVEELGQADKLLWYAVGAFDDCIDLLPMPDAIANLVAWC